jgi:hypothetical protein
MRVAFAHWTDVQARGRWDMSAVESILEQVGRLTPDERQLLMKQLALSDLRETMKRIGSRPEEPLPLSDQEIDELVHASRGEMLRARGL